MSHRAEVPLPGDRAAPEPSSPAADPTEAAAPRLLRLSAGFVYFVFGFLKFYTDLSPAELLASQTIMSLWPWSVDAHAVLLWLACAEVVIGLSFLLNLGLRWVFWIFVVHQIGTFLPLVVYPELTFKIAPFAPTLEGQYILKNLVSLAAGLTVMLPAVRAGGRRRRTRRPGADTSAWPGAAPAGRDHDVHAAPAALSVSRHVPHDTRTLGS